MVNRSRAWGFGAVLTLAMGAGPLIVFSISALSPILIQDLGIDRVQLGILATVTYVAAMPLCLAAGRVLRHVSPRRILVMLFLLTAVALVSVGGASAWPLLCVAAACSGVVQSLSNPVTNLLVSQAPPEQPRGVVMGVKQAGVQMAQLIAGVLPLAALLISWRAAVLCLLVVPVVAVGLTLTNLKSEDWRKVASVTVKGFPPRAWWLFAYTLFVATAVQATNMYLPLFGVERLRIDPAVAGASMLIIGALGMISRISWGRVMDGPLRPSTALRVLALSSMAGCVSFVLANISGVSALFWVGVVLHGAGAIAANVVIIHALIDCVEPGQVASASGYQALAQYVGFAVGPLSFGVLVDLSDSYLVAWSLALASYVAALAIAWRFLPRSER